MNKESLLEKRADIEQRFGELQKQQNDKNEELKQINEEMIRLQGDYRSLTELIDNFETPIEAEIVKKEKK